MSNPRIIASQLLQTIIENKISLTEAKNQFEIENNEQNFINMLLLTGLRRYTYIENILNKYIHKKLPPKVYFAHYVMILAVTELFYMDTPDYAVLNTYIDIIKQNTDKYVGGFANAVLRNLIKDKEHLISDTSFSSLPTDFIKILQAGYTSSQIKHIQQAFLNEPSLDLTIKNNPNEWAKQLDGTLLPTDSVRLFSAGKIEHLSGYSTGDWWVQDIAASLAVKTLETITGKSVLDICAAPGGKTAQLINAGAKVTAIDISGSRLQLLDTNLQRLKMHTEATIQADGLEYLQNFNSKPFDIILLDAPCSATGTLRRHPEIPLIKKSADIKKQSQFQKKFLEATENALKINGILLYCTCSISPVEGEFQIKEFIKNNPHFKIISIDNIDIPEIITKEGFIRTLPYHLENLGGMDSFFIAKLQRIK